MLVLVVLGLMAPSTQAISPDAITGVWLTQKEDGYIEINKIGARYQGKIIGSPSGDTSRVDINNPQPQLRSRPLLGVVIIDDMMFAEDEWRNGTIYDPDNGKTYRCRLSIADGELIVRGYIGNPLFGRTQRWTRHQ